jgi:hypothetical protein
VTNAELVERERQLAWQLIEEIGNCEDGMPEGGLVELVRTALESYRLELRAITDAEARRGAERLEALEKQLAALTKRP